MRSLYLYFLLFMLSHAAVAQTQDERKLNRLFDKLTVPLKDTAKSMVFIEIAEHYYSVRKTTAHWLDSLLKYSSLSMELAKKSGHQKFQWRVLLLQSTGYLLSGNPKKAMATITQAHDTLAIGGIRTWAKYYYDPFYSHRLNYDSSAYFMQQALLLSEKTNVARYIGVSHCQLAELYCKRNDTVAALRHASIASSYYKGPDASIGNMWYNMGIGIVFKEQYFPFKMACYERSLAIHRQLGKASLGPIGQAYMSMSDIYDQQGQKDLAERKLLEAERLLLEAKDKMMYPLYLRLHDLQYYKGNSNKAVYYALEALKSAEAASIKNLHQYYLYVGNSYYDMGQAAKSIEYYNKAFASARATDGRINGVLIKRMAKAMIADGKVSEALDFVQRANQEFEAHRNEDIMMKQEAMAICYMALKQYKEAEQYYLRMNDLSRSVDKYYKAICPYVLGKFYYTTNDYNKAVPYLSSCLDAYKDYLPVMVFSEVSLILYRIDSARQQHHSAMMYFRQHKLIEDSISTTTKVRQVEELRMQYDIEKKDKELQLQVKDIELLTRQKLLQQSLAEQKSKDVLLKQQSIDLLKQQQSLQEVLTGKQQQDLAQKEKELQLQQENIDLLHNKEQLQESQLKQANFIKKMTIAGIVLLLVIVGLLYNQYRIKHRNNRRISVQNDKLHNLLEEKEWLLKEVHHRVKNNLQVVLSLLQSQSAYLKDEALAAVHDSQHRVQAMSLIHQKLYQTDNVSTINMDTYIPELVDYLKDSFVVRTRIVFAMDIAPVALDITQAIPLGLIINEAVTNIFKHAFPDRERGQVHISLKQLNEEELILDITDNGVGLPVDPTHFSPSSLGLNLMKGLCRDFNGRYSIESNNGTHICIVFNRHIYQATASTAHQLTGYDA
jgi:two-component system, sensor histidine kinase PdtaS